MGHLYLQLFGAMRLSPGPEAPDIRVTSRKAQALMAYLAVPLGRPHARETLATLLWADRSGKDSRHNLRQCLTTLRQLLAAAEVDPLIAEGAQVRLDARALQTDVAEFERLASEKDAASLERACALYQGDFLAGLNSQSEPFEDWLLGERLRLRSLAADVMGKHMERTVEAGASEAAQQSALRLLSIDSLREAAHRTLMQIHFDQGRSAAALKQYAVCEEVLRKELGVAPDAETQALRRRIANHRTKGPPAGAQGAAAIAEAAKRPATRTPAVERDRPSIAVLPFANFSDDRDLGFLADGLVDDITILLARIPGFLVISRSSSFFYRGKSPDLRDVGSELDVTYVVRGSLRRMGLTVRIAAELVEAASGEQLWADRFDKRAEAISELQDDIVNGILARLEPELTRAEMAKIVSRPPSESGAWSLYLRAHGMLAGKGWHEDTFEEAAEILGRAIELDPDFALAHAYLSLLLAMGHRVGLAKDRDAASTMAREAGERALALDDRDSTLLGYVGCALADLGDFRRGIPLLEKALEANPSNAQAWAALGAALILKGDCADGVERLRHGMRISPLDNRLAIWGSFLASGLLALQRIDEAVEESRLACRRDHGLYLPRVILAACYAAQGRAEEAKHALADGRRVRPGLSRQEIEALVGPQGLADLRQVDGSF